MKARNLAFRLAAAQLGEENFFDRDDDDVVTPVHGHVLTLTYASGVYSTAERVPVALAASWSEIKSQSDAHGVEGFAQVDTAKPRLRHA